MFCDYFILFFLATCQINYYCEMLDSYIIGYILFLHEWMDDWMDYVIILTEVTYKELFLSIVA